MAFLAHLHMVGEVLFQGNHFVSLLFHWEHLASVSFCGAIL